MLRKKGSVEYYIHVMNFKIIIEPFYFYSIDALINIPYILVIRSLKEST